MLIWKKLEISSLSRLDSTPLVLLAPLASMPFEPPRWTTILRADEIARANRFLHQADRQRFVVGRYILRKVLADYYDCEPESLIFGSGPFGKPYLLTPGTSTPLHFNVSHSGNVILLAFSRYGAIGVDIEEIKPQFPVSEIASDCLGGVELPALEHQEGVDKQLLFFKLWTMREAALKASGMGLSGLGRLSTSFASPDSPEYTMSLDGIPWRVVELPRFGDYSAAVAMAAGGPELDLRIWQFDGQDDWAASFPTRDTGPAGERAPDAS